MAESLALLNVYEVETEHGPASLLCFLDPVLAGAKGIEPRSIVGEYVTGEGGGFDPDGFRVHPAFVEALTGFMNEEAAETADVAGRARTLASGWLYVLDPRDRSGDGAEPPTANVLGAFAVDDDGQVVPGSFQYNANHKMFDAEHGTSGVLFDRSFYDWFPRFAGFPLCGRPLWGPVRRRRPQRTYGRPPTSQPMLQAAWKL